MRIPVRIEDTGLDSRFEAELGLAAHRPSPLSSRADPQKPGRLSAAPTPQERKIEEAMILGR